MFVQAWVIAEEVGNRAGVGAACGDLGGCYRIMGQYDTVIALHDQGQVVLNEIGNQVGVGKACSNLGLCYDDLGQYDCDTAIVLHEQSRVIF